MRTSSGVELRAGGAQQHLLRVVVRHGAPVRPVGRERGEDVRDGEKARFERDVVAGEHLRVAFAVGPLVVGEIQMATSSNPGSSCRIISEFAGC